MSRFGLNAKKAAFLAALAEKPSLDGDGDRLTIGCKFNFAYFTTQAASQSFGDWTHPDLVSLLGKLKEYCKRPLSDWAITPVGKSGTVLAIYGGFPANSDLEFPKHVPHQAKWGRFRLESAVRLVGFVVPPEYTDKMHAKSGYRFDCNTFYVVFLDKNHAFYKTESK